MARIGFDEYHMGTSVANPDSDGLSMIADHLVSNAHEVERIQGELPTGEPLPWDVVVIPFPKNLFSEEEMMSLHEHLRSGKGLLLLAEWGDLFDVVDHLNLLTSPYGINIQKDRVTDLSEHITQEVRLGGVLLDEQPMPHFVRIRNFSNHPVVEGLEELIYFSGCSLRTEDGAVVLAATEETSFGDLDLDVELDDDEDQGVLPIAAASEVAGRLVVVGDSNIAANGYIDKGDNMGFVTQALEWLLFER